VGALAHRFGGDAEQAGQLLVGALLLEDQLDDGSLVWCKGVEAHERGSVVEAAAIVRRMADAQPLHNEPLPGFDGHYGLQILQADGNAVRGRLEVGPQHLQPAGIVHGGVYAAMTESLASTGTWFGVGEGKFVAGMSNLTTFLRPIREGTIHADGAPLHSGRTTWVWDVRITDDEGRTCATSRVTIAVRDAR
jgi:1,4-dihydroxy-2-naphthoyl-CoA hydrolase